MPVLYFVRSVMFVGKYVLGIDQVPSHVARMSHSVSKRDVVRVKSGRTRRV